MAAASGARAARRRRLLATVVAPIAVVVAIVAIFVVVKASSGGSPKQGQGASAAAASVIRDVTSVPAAVLDAVGVGSVTALPKALSGAPLTAGGLPQVLYVGAEFCPYCAAERWGIAVALSRFGTFTNLGQTASNPSDVYPNTATLDFHGARYTSSYLAFTGKEIESNTPAPGGGYTALDTLTPAEQSLFTSVGGGSFPFLDIGGKYVITGASYLPSVLAGKTHEQIAAALSDPGSSVARAVDGTANVITAAVCASTANKPAAVCTASGVLAAGAKLRGKA